MNKIQKTNFFSYNFFPKNRRGTDKMLSMYWFVIIFIVAAAIVYMTALFYGKPYDVRELETNLLINKVSDCLVENGYLINEVFVETFKSDFLEICNLNFNVEGSHGWKNDQYYLELSISEFVDQSIFIIGPFSEGNINLRDLCSNELNNNPFCIEKGFYSIDKENKEYFVKIFVSLRKTEKNVR